MVTVNKSYIKMSYCKPISAWQNFGVNAVVHGTILFTVLTCIYYFLLTKIQDKAFEGVIEGQLGPVITNLMQKLDENSNGELKKGIKGSDGFWATLSEIYSQPDELKVRNNKLVFFIAFSIAVFLIVGITIWVIASKMAGPTCLPIGHILKENAATFAAVGAFEGYFLITYAVKYIPDIPSSVITNVMARVRHNIVGN